MRRTYKTKTVHKAIKKLGLKIGRMKHGHTPLYKVDPSGSIYQVARPPMRNKELVLHQVDNLSRTLEYSNIIPRRQFFELLDIV